MNRDPGPRASLRCRSCGTARGGGRPTVDRLGKIYQVVVACAACHTSFVALLLPAFACALAWALAAGTLSARAQASPPAHRVPKTAVHTEFVVETNRLGQVTRVRSGVQSKDLAFNALTYGNALQAFIRTESGDAVAGTYRLTYDYNPHSKAVKRSVALLRAGGVNPWAPGAVTVEVQKLAKESRKAKAGATASAEPLPDLTTITGSGH